MRPPGHRVFTPPLLAASLAAALGAGAGPLMASQQQQQQQQQQQRQQQEKPQDPQQKVPPFKTETRVDIILVDVNIVDKEGKPVDGLGAADFKVAIDGRPRRIHSVQFVTQAAEAEPAETDAPRVSSNVQAGRGRLFMVVLDETNLSVGDARALDEPLEKFFASLGPRDRVGLATIPVGGPRIDFTSDSARVRRAIKGVTGLASLGSALLRFRIGLSEAFACEGGTFEWSAVVARECAGRRQSDLVMCQQDLEADARTLVADARHRASATLGALYDIVRQLRSVDGPKTLVLVSGGIVTERDDTMTVSVAAEAAAANTSIYVLHLERPLADASESRPSPTLSADQNLGREGLEMVAGRARGELFRVPTSSESALARIARETSGYYLLALDAEPADRDGRTHRVRVELASGRRGLTLRSRREFRHEVATEAGATDETRLSAMLSAPTTIDDVPLRASAYTTGDPARGKVQVQVAAEIGAAATSEETMTVGFLLLDVAGRPRAAVGHRLVLQPVDPQRPSPLRYSASVLVDPGDYTLKLGVIRPDGRRGSIEHPVRARMTTAGSLQIGDLFVLDAPVSGSIVVRPEVLARLTGRRVAAYCEMYAADASKFEQVGVSVEIAASEDGPMLIGGKSRAAGTEATRRLVQVAVTTTMLPPGDYVARVIITERGEEVARLRRAFRVERPLAAVGEASPGAGAPGLLETVVPKTVFQPEALLEPAALAPFIDMIGTPSSPRVATAIEEARHGRFETVLDPPASPDMAASFLRGLALFSRGDLNNAAIAFRAALRASGDFFPAAFFLGACHAAGGRDTEAAGAWQTSLITLENVPLVYEMLADALVRLGRYKEAREILEDAASRFPDHESLEPRRAAVALGLGDAFDAYGRVAAFLERHPDDNDALFLVIRLLYEAVANERMILGRDADRSALQDFARRYTEGKGPHAALVAQWLKAVQRQSDW